ncbi:amine sulfotransferase-like [Podarcis lilfordi]|uniref:Sulfotransferase n=1 Tax=Podarcis lilfordi TaxID=74358 RepID=A0AA35K3X2_9SAUR|nr:amine sulfotransferase-like [Podarcis lilfordi]
MESLESLSSSSSLAWNSSPSLSICCLPCASLPEPLTVVKLEEVEDFGIFMERFLAGKVLASLWLDHVEGWYTHKDDFNILFLTYEEMKKDLRSCVLKLCNFLGKRLTEKEVDVVVDQATFNKMKADPRANYEFPSPDRMDHNKGHFLRKGTVGDWKNMMTVAQSESYRRNQSLPLSCTLFDSKNKRQGMQPDEKYLFTYKGFYFQSVFTSVEYLDSLEDFEIRDSDVFIVTYPKSGTIWTQNILSLIYHEGHRDGTEKVDLLDRAPWLEYNIRNVDYVNRPSPRLFASHLPYYLVPKGLRNRRAKVVYVARNPKDVLVSFYHFSKTIVKLEEVEDFGIFMERFLAGKVLASLWLDHVEGWYTHKDDFNILFLTYEEMKKDLRSCVLKLCNFLGKRLTEKELDVVVDQATFNKMKADPRANYEFSPPDLMDHSKGHFLHKGTVGDWKNMMTVAQSEKFDSVFKERMEKLPFKFCWDIHEES